MLTRPRFQPHVQLASVPGEGVFVLSGARQSLLRGRLYELVTPHIDGRTADEICERLAPEVSPAEVYYTLAQLEKKGYLVEDEDSLSGHDAAWWSLQKIDPQTAAQRLANNSVSVRGLGVAVEPLCELLSAAGVRVDKESNLSVVVVDHYLRSDLELQNAAALAESRPWLLMKPYGEQFWLGPLFRPGETACWKCLAERLRANRSVEGFLHERRALAEPLAVDRARTAPSLHVAWGLAANAIASWIVRGALPECEGKVRTFDQLSWETKTHALVKLPYCPACGRGVNHCASNGVAGGHHLANGHASNGHATDGSPINFGSGARPLLFADRSKTIFQDGGSRSVHPETTIERFGHHVSPITGAVSMLERTGPANDGAMHVYLAGHNVARRHRDLGQLRGDLRNMAAGKGTTDAQARASGLCEALERHSGVFRGDEPRRKARLADLGDSAIDVRECLLFSERQYRDREAINESDSPYNFVPLPFDPDAEIEWSPLWSLTRQETRYLPTAFCYYDYPLPKERRFCIADSNGNAAGNTIEEAVLQGFLELVERDSVALWWYNRIARPGVDLASFNEPYLEKLAESLAGYDREMSVLDLTADLGIPVFAAWSRRKRGDSEQILMGFGAHLDARIALLRAATEMNQMLSYLLRSPLENDRRVPVTDRETVEWLKTATLVNQPYLVPRGDVPLKKHDDFRPATGADVAGEVRDCQQRVERHGLEMLVLDQTRPEIGLPVVKVVVPGLRHFWTRFAPGRLYDVPVQMGWLKQPLREDELNPIPMFL